MICYVAHMEHLITPQEAARILGVSTSTVKRWFDAGMVDGVKHPSGHHRYVKESVEKLRPVRISSTVTVIHPNEGAA